MFWSNEAIAAATGALAIAPISYVANTVLNGQRGSLARLGPLPDIIILAVVPLVIVLYVSNIDGEIRPDSERPASIHYPLHTEIG